MSGKGRNRVREDRGLYSPPAMRKNNQKVQQQQQEVQQQQQQQKDLEEKKLEQKTEQLKTTSLSVEQDDLTNLDRFMGHTTPIVPAHYFSKTSMKGWRNHDDNFHPYFILGDLWESLKEWSAYGAGVPLVLNENDLVVQYYVPYLSGIQLYIDPSTSLSRLRPGEESEAESMSSEGSNEFGANGMHRAWAKDITAAMLRDDPYSGPVDDEAQIKNPPGLLIYEYFANDLPYNREPLSDKMTHLASEFPGLKTFRSCDLSPASWISVAWYPIYRIPVGPSLQNVDACFLTYHSLSTPFGSTNMDWPHIHGSTIREGQNAGLSLPIFGLAAYKFKVPDWIQTGVHGSEKLTSLVQAANNWLRLLRVNHHDLGFFLSHSTYWR